jgi:hypothetical protein
MPEKSPEKNEVLYPDFPAPQHFPHFPATLSTRGAAATYQPSDSSDLQIYMRKPALQTVTLVTSGLIN